MIDKLFSYLLTALGLIAGAIGLFFYGKRNGAYQAKTEFEKEDLENAQNLYSRYNHDTRNPDRLREYEGQYRD